MLGDVRRVAPGHLRGSDAAQMRSRVGTGRRWGLLVVALMLLVGTAAAATAVPPSYPDPPEDFAHPSDLHRVRYSPTGGTAIIPLLVVAPQFTDVTDDPNFDTAAEISQRFFGPTSASITTYLSAISGGRLDLVPAAEGVGVANDGVVIVNGGQVGPFIQNEYQNILRAADPLVNFATFDTDGDGAVRTDELIVVGFRTSRGAGDAGGQSTDNILASLDGVNTQRVGVSRVATATNRVTIAHELLHVAVDMLDFYGYGVGDLDIAGFTIQGAVPTTSGWTPSEDDRYAMAYNALHWGWGAPQVVTADGYRDVPVYRGDAARSFLLYDPEQGTDDYFLVENRRQTGLDAGIADQGLAIWRVADDEFVHTTDARRPVEAMVPAGWRVAGCNDVDVDGLDNEDPPGGTAIVGGAFDVNGDGAITGADTVNGAPGFEGLALVNGLLYTWQDADQDGTWDDTDSDGLPDAGTVTRIVGGVRVIGGAVDADGDGTISAADTGDPWQGVDNDNDNAVRTSDGLDNDRDGSVDEANEGVDEDRWDGPGCFGPGGTGAWDPADGATPQRTMQRPWLDGELTSAAGGAPTSGTPTAGVAVRAIWPRAADGRIRAFFDVRGPGILVDTFDPARTGPLLVEVDPGQRAPFLVNVRNTQDVGEPLQEFEFRPIRLPAGWTGVSDVRSLTPQWDRTAWVQVHPAADALAGEEHEIQVLGRATDGSGSSSAPVLVRVVPTPKPPDSLENNDVTPTTLTLDQHEHLNVAVLADGASPRGSTERWWTRVDDLSLHDGNDLDRFHVVLPDRTDPTDGGHSELGEVPECGEVIRQSAADIEERVVLSAAFTAKLVNPPRNVAGERLRIDTDAPVTGTDLDREIPCPATAGVTEVDFDFGIYPGLRQNFPTYDLEAGYVVDVVRMPADDSTWLAAQRSKEAGSVTMLTCGGFAAFPRCGPQPHELGHEVFTRTVPHPYASGRDCSPQCPDYFPFSWDATGAFDLSFTTDAALAFTLLDHLGSEIATAVPVDAASFASAYRTTQSTDETTTYRLFAPDLAAGAYVLRVEGPLSSYDLAFVPPPGPLAASLSASPADVPEPGGPTTFTLELVNASDEPLAVKGLFRQGTQSLDGAGTCDLTAAGTLEPGATYTCSYPVEVTGGGGDEHVETVAVEAQDEIGHPVERSAAATVQITDRPPTVEASLTLDPTTVTEGGAQVGAKLVVTNPSAVEPLQLDRIAFELLVDRDGDGVATPDETAGGEAPSLPTPTFGVTDCAPGGALAPQETYACTAALTVDSPPWGDPTLVATVDAGDDEGNRTTSDARATAQVSGAARHVEIADLAARLLPSFETIEGGAGLVDRPTGDHLAQVELRLREPDGLDALVRGAGIVVEQMVDGRWTPLAVSCSVSPGLPVAASPEAALVFVCAADSPLPAGSRLRVTPRLVVDGQDGEIQGDTVAELAPDVVRHAGAAREQTAVAVARATYPDGAQTLVLARSDLYPDSLAGAPLAHALEAPLLLTPSDVLAPSVAAEIGRLGASHVVLLGGTAALSEELRGELLALPTVTTVDRIGGADRFETAALVAAQFGNSPAAYVAEGADPNPRRGWPDALAVSPLAAHQARPILLVTTETLPEATADALRDLDTTSVTVVGGPAAVSDAVVDALAAVVGTPPARLAGATRYETSSRIAEAAAAAGLDPARTWLATGNNFPDALVAGPAVARDGGVMLLLDGQAAALPTAITDWTRLYRDLTLQRLALLGGPAAISDHLEAELRQLVGSAEP